MKLKPTCRCNMCETEFNDDDELFLIETEKEAYKVCPHCNTDAYLMDLNQGD